MGLNSSALQEALLVHLASVVTVGGAQTPLTSVSAIEAAESAGVVTIIDTGVTFICPVQAYKG